MDMDGHAGIPLPERMRPQNLDEFLGQDHLIGPNGLLRRLLMQRRLLSVILWGPPGTGKTTLAKLLAKEAGARFVELSAVSSGAKELREVFAAAVEEKRFYGTQTVLFIDEIHRYSKAQQDLLLPAVERGDLYLIASTTQNPRICLTLALLSRTQVCQLRALSEQDIEAGARRALDDPVRGLGSESISFAPDAWRLLVLSAGGDLRKALHTLEWAVFYAKGGAVEQAVSIDHVTEAIQGTPLARFDESVLYDMLSAFCKSLRGSDSDAALYWFFRLLDAGIDPRVPLRRLIVHASEDVGLASPVALQQAVAAMQALEFVGLPEARIPIAQAIIFVCESPKSNSVVAALARLEEAIKCAPHAEVPSWLRDRHFPREVADDRPYLYPHDFPGHFVLQQYLPNELSGEVFYRPSKEGTEVKIRPRKSKDL